MKNKIKEKRLIKLTDKKLLTRASQDDAGNKILEGYAAVFNQRSKLLFDWDGTFYEVIERNAFDDVLSADNLDVILTYQHNLGEPLARANKLKGVESLTLSVDDYGLKFRAVLNNTTAANDTFERVKSGDCFECSFVFSVESSGQRWEEEEEDQVRYITKVSGLFDVSVVVNAAYENTDVAAAERSYKEFREEEEKEEQDKAPDDVYFDKFKIELLELGN